LLTGSEAWLWAAVRSYLESALFFHNGAALAGADGKGEFAIDAAPRFSLPLPAWCGVGTSITWRDMTRSTPARNTGASGVNSTSSSAPGTWPQPFPSHRTISRARVGVQARAGNWHVEATYEVLIWDDIVRGDFERPLLTRLLNTARVYGDFIANGTMFRYIVANARYAGFFLFPILSFRMSV
jgi:hypothetical protein